MFQTLTFTLIFGKNFLETQIPINLMSYCIVEHHYWDQWQAKENRTSSYNEKHLLVCVFWSHYWLSISNLGDFVLIWWEYVWLITRHDVRPFYIFQIWENTCFTWYIEKHLLVGVFWGYCTKYKCIIFIDLWFYLNKYCVYSQLLLVELKWPEDWAWYMSSQQTMSLVNWAVL